MVSASTDVFSLDVDGEHTGRQRTLQTEHWGMDINIFAMHARLDDWATAASPMHSVAECLFSAN